MKAKQLATIKTKFEELARSGHKAKPDDCTCEISLAIISDTPPKLRSREDIIAAAKKAIVCDRYSNRTTLGFADVFHTPPNTKLAEWEKHEADLAKRSGKFHAEGQAIITRAELDEDSDAQEVMEQLAELAMKHGLTQ